MKQNKFKHKYLRLFIKNKKVSDPILKSALYGAMFDQPKKVLKGISIAKNEKHKDYIVKIMNKVATIGKSNNTLKIIGELQ